MLKYIAYVLVNTVVLFTLAGLLGGIPASIGFIEYLLVVGFSIAIAHLQVIDDKISGKQ